MLDYTIDGSKGFRNFEPTLSYQTARVLPDKVSIVQNSNKVSIVQNHNRSGILFFTMTETQFDLVDATGAVVIERKTPVIEIAIPRIDFSGVSRRILKPNIMGRSLDVLADYLTSNHQGAKFVMGLTHSRLGRLASRWGLLMEEQPFSADAHQFIETCLKDPQADPVAIENLEAFKNQVLIYQPRAEFIKRVERSKAS